jgi:hypothetical protein
MKLTGNFKEMNNITKAIIAILLIWNIALSVFVFIAIKKGDITSNQVRNIYNKTTTISHDELSEEGSHWEFFGRNDKND